MNLLIGCPVRARTWILERWFEHTENAARKAEITPCYMFVCGADDEKTIECIVDQASKYEAYSQILVVEEPARVDNRTWSHERYRHMVYIRNELLAGVEEFAPDFFLSLDSDILLHPDCMKNLLESSSKFDVVGGKCYMTPHGTRAPSYAHLNRMNNMLRPNADGVFGVDILMAIKLMNRAAYSLRYEFEPRGEDLGISKVWRENGLTLGWDGRITNKHIMSPAQLDSFDSRCGF